LLDATTANTMFSTARSPTNALTFVIPVGITIRRRLPMNERQVILLRGVMDSINATLEMYENDATHAPADWLLENWWHTLEAVITFRDTES
jgi:hypothetical protein